MTISNTSEGEQGNTNHLVYQGEACHMPNYITGSRSSKIIRRVRQPWSEGVAGDRCADSEGV